MLIISYFLVPKKIFYGWYHILAIIFILVFALTATCLVRSIKDRIIEHKKQKTHSILGILFGVIGLSALHTCAIGAPVCGASVGMAIVSAFFPAVAFDFMSDYSVEVITVSILIQIFSMHQMKCFSLIKNIQCRKNEA
jgi:hypothetical protein